MYELTSPSLDFSHAEFTVVTEPITHTLCGSLTYQADLSGQTLSPSTVPMSYEEASRTFSVYSQDDSHANSYMISLTASFANVQNGVVATLESQFDILMPDLCLNPALTASSPVQQEYTISDT